ncbi:MAG: hypothetical protein HS111_31435 [Kofleriaceae bacterium]|nr:hypothetical protein [Kofleriaceae bacterium]MCL4227750.1 hypothetical protein [Myxococcales bacterium]
MPTRPDLRDITTGVKDALADSDRDALLEMLTFLIKEYVVDGPPPMLVHQAETLADLSGLSFAQLVTALQTRLELPELSLFVVDGEQVSVRIGGAMHVLGVGGAAASAAAEMPRPSAGVRVVETQLQPRPPAAAPAAEPRTAPPPARGLSVRGQPGAAGGGATAAPAASSTPVAPASASGSPGAGPGAPAAAPADKPEGSGDDASARFSLLELD